MTGEVMN